MDYSHYEEDKQMSKEIMEEKKLIDELLECVEFNFNWFRGRLTLDEENRILGVIKRSKQFLNRYNEEESEI